MKDSGQKFKGLRLGYQGRFLKETYELYWTDVCQYLGRRMKSQPHEVCDIAQGAFEKLASVKNPESILNPKAYLYVTARNMLIDQVRKENSRLKNVTETSLEAWNEPKDNLSPEHIMLQREKLGVLMRAIEKLPAKRRRVFILNRVHGLSYREISKEMNIGEATVKKHVFRALKFCHEILSKQLGANGKGQ